jgi:hypothetical protein
VKASILESFSEYLTIKQAAALNGYPAGGGSTGWWP